MSTIPGTLPDLKSAEGPAGMPEATPKSPHRRFYRPELDALRFFAFLEVFLHHATYNIAPLFSRVGGFGLSLFFLLSAFLITELLQREKNSTGTIAIRDFYIRRSLRIWPLYFGFVLLMPIVAFFIPSQPAHLGFMLAFLFMAGNIYTAHNDIPPNASGYLWSISVEEQFYIFWPWLNKVCSPSTLKRIAYASLPLAAITTYLLATSRGSANMSVWDSSIVEFQFFGFGALLALYLKGSLPTFPIAGRILLFITGCALWFAAARFTHMVDQAIIPPIPLMIGYPMVGLGCVALFLSVYGAPGHWFPKPIVYLGKISFGLYVYHRACLDFAEWLMNLSPTTSSAVHHARYGIGHVVIGFTLTIVLSVLSYRFYETPFLKLKERFAIVRSRAV